MCFAKSFPRKGTSSYLKEANFLVVRVGKRQHEIAIEQKESLRHADAFMRFLNRRHLVLGDVSLVMSGLVPPEGESEDA
jgi:hypothetical protein